MLTILLQLKLKYEIVSWIFHFWNSFLNNSKHTAVLNSLKLYSSEFRLKFLCRRIGTAEWLVVVAVVASVTVFIVLSQLSYCYHITSWAPLELCLKTKIIFVCTCTCKQFNAMPYLTGFWGECVFNCYIILLNCSFSY